MRSQIPTHFILVVIASCNELSLHSSLVFVNNFFNKTAILTKLKICEQNYTVLLNLTKFHNDDVIQTKIMIILSTGVF